MQNRRPVVVKQLPARLDREQAQTVIREVLPLLKGDQPHVVFDLSQVQRMDSAGVDMLLKCLQEVMRRDGDLKLAAVPPESAIVLNLTRLDRVFEIFVTTSDAVESFYAFSVEAPQRSGAEFVSSIPAELREEFKAAS